MLLLSYSKKIFSGFRLEKNKFLFLKMLKVQIKSENTILNNY